MKTTQKVDGAKREAEHVETELTVRYRQLEFDFERGSDNSLTSDDDGPEGVEEGPAN